MSEIECDAFYCIYKAVQFIQFGTIENRHYVAYCKEHSYNNYDLKLDSYPRMNIF